MGKETTVCPFCHERIATGLPKCPQCGENLGARPRGQVRPESPRLKGAGAIQIILGLLAGIMVPCMGLGLLMQSVLPPAQPPVDGAGRRARRRGRAGGLEAHPLVASPDGHLRSAGTALNGQRRRPRSLRLRQDRLTASELQGPTSAPHAVDTLGGTEAWRTDRSRSLRATTPAISQRDAASCAAYILSYDIAWNT